MHARLAALGVSIALALGSLAGCGGNQAGSKKTKGPGLDFDDKVRLSEAYVKSGQFGKALSTMEDVLVEEPDKAALHNFYGQILFLAARYDQAAKSLLRALELDPYFTDAHNNLGAVYNELNRKDDAEREFLLALEDPAYPTPEKARLNLGVLYATQGRIEETIEQLRTAVEIDPKYYQAHYELASVLDRTGKLDEAAREYEVATPAYRSSAEFHYRIGFAYMRLGDVDKAKRHLNRVLELSPGSRNAVRADELLKTLG